jgi:hypothetical protein
MQLKDRESIIQFVERDYFGSVRDQATDAVMRCFHADATVLIRHGDNPVRRFAVKPSSENSDLRDFYAHLVGNYEAWFGDFTHFVDIQESRSACYFTVRLTPRPGGLYSGAGTQELKNCNFFEYADDKIRHMIIYYSNVNSDAADSTPTGYPR